MSQALMLQAQAYWQARSPRERRVLQIWLVIMSCAALYFAVYAPLSKEINRLNRAVPLLESQLMALRGSKPEVVAVKPAAAQQDLRSAAFAWLSAKKISADVRSLSETQLELRATLPTVREAVSVAQTLRSELAAKVSTVQIKSDAQGTSLLLVLERS